jgi:hypothetical protein
MKISEIIKAEIERHSLGLEVNLYEKYDNHETEVCLYKSIMVDTRPTPGNSEQKIVEKIVEKISDELDNLVTNSTKYKRTVELKEKEVTFLKENIEELEKQVERLKRYENHYNLSYELQNGVKEMLSKKKESEI